MASISIGISVGSPVVDYNLTLKNRDRLLAQFRKDPQYVREVNYYRENIAKVTNVDQLLKDRRLLTVALSAFQLESEVDAKGILKKLLTEDPTDQNSLAQRMRDPRFLKFAQAFSTLKSDGGASIQSPTTMGVILDGYETNEFEKALGEADPAVRQALYVKRTIEDKIDTKTVDGLLATFRKSETYAADVKYYQDNIKNVTGVDSLVDDERLRKVVLSAFKLDELQDQPLTVKRLLMESTTQDNALAKSDPRFMQFAKAFSMLWIDGGATVTADASITATLSAFERNEFQKSLAEGDAATQKATYGADGATGIAGMLAKFQQRPSIAASIDYYKNTIGRIASADALIADKRLLNVALSAFNLEALAGNPDSVKKLLTEDPTADTSLAYTDTRYKEFADAFASLRVGGTGPSLSSPTNIATIVAKFTGNEFEKSLSAKVTEANANHGAMTVYTVLGDATLSAVSRKALNLPDQTGALSVAQQVSALSRAHFDVNKLTEPGQLAKFITRFLVNTGTDQINAASGGAAILSLFQPPSDGIAGLGAGGGLNLLA